MIPFGRALSGDLPAPRGGLYRRAVMAMFSQGGKSDTFLDVMGQRADQRPAPMLYVGPTRQFLIEQFEPRIMALLDEAPTLRGKVARGKRMTKTRKLIAGVPLRLAHGGSSAALKSDPAALALVDEYDEMLANVKGQGDPLGLVEARGETYSDFVCGVVSTTSIGAVEVERDADSGLEFWKVADPQDVESPIWRKWQEGTRHHWCWPCPHCAEYFVPRFRNLKWPKGATPAEARRTAWVECPECGGAIEDEHKADMNARGVYVAPGQRVDKSGKVNGDPEDTSTISFWVSGLASPFKSFGERAERFLQAVASGDPHEVQTAINAAFGEAFAPSGGEAPEWRSVAVLRGGYRLGEVPQDAEILTLAADVQKDRIVYIVRGWGSQATSWLIDRDEVWAESGSTEEEEVWDNLADIVAGTYDGLPIRLALVDSGFRPGKPIRLPENRIYQFCRRFAGRRVLPTKGHDTQRTPVIVRKPEVTSRGKVSRYGLDLIHLDTDYWKRWVFERIAWPQDRPGAWHLPEDLDDGYCMQVASERRLVTASGRVTWKQTSQANHYLDCESMVAAAGFILQVHRRRSAEERVSAADVVKRVSGGKTAFAMPAPIAASDPYL